MVQTEITDSGRTCAGSAHRREGLVKPKVMDNPDLVDAIRERHVVELRYHRYSRIVEPYVYGLGRDGLERIRCYQIAGESDSGEMIGWKLLRVEEIVSLRVTETRFAARDDYRRDDPVIAHVTAQV